MEQLDSTLCILCGGLGTRVSAISGRNPKSMLDIAGTPLLQRVWLQSTRNTDFEATLMLAGYRSNAIVEFVQNEPHMASKCKIIVEDQPLGTGGAVLNALSNILTEDFVVINGDTLTNMDIKSFVLNARKIGASCAIGGAPVEDVSEYGALDVETDGSLNSFLEKQASGPGIANCGVVYFHKTALEKYHHYTLRNENLSLERDLLKTLSSSIHVFVNDCTTFLDVGTPDRYAEAKTIRYEI